MGQERRVLLIGNYWPYVSGGHRIFGLVSHLEALGWFPVIVSQPLDRPAPAGPFELVEAPYPGDILRHWRTLAHLLLTGASSHGAIRTDQGLKEAVKARLGFRGRATALDKAFKWYQELFAYPDLSRSWRKPALEICERIVREQAIEFVISNYPITSHLIASELKRKFRLPWIADFVDLWSQNHNYPFGKLRRRIDQRLELKTLRSADAIVTVSEPLAETIRLINPPEKVFAIPHGYEPHTYNDPPAPVSEKFLIAYTGQIYPEFQDPEPFFSAIRELLDEGRMDPLRLGIEFYGAQEPWLVDLVRKYRLEGQVRLQGRLPKEEIILKQRKAQILFVMSQKEPGSRGVFTSKIFDYLAARRPVLATNGYADDVLARLLSDTKAGHFYDGQGDIKSYLARAYRQYLETGRVPYEGIDSQVSLHSHRQMTRRFVHLMNGIKSGSGLPTEKNCYCWLPAEV